jgi:ABC-type Mn2+/Zn2+ transport system permease subunit
MREALADFLAAWPLFGNAWLAGLLLAVLLPLLGVILVARDQVFLAAAIGQAGTLGIAFATWLGASVATAGHTDALALPAALAFAVLAAGLATRSGVRGGEQAQAREAFAFLLGGAGSMLLLARHPHGLAEVQRLMFSSLLGASALDAALAGAGAAAAVLACAVAGDRLLLWTFDPTTAQALGTNARAWARGVALAAGLAIGFGIHCAGLLFTFGVTVLPALVARRVARTMHGTLALAPVLGVIATAAGLVAAHALDLPPGQVVVALLCGALTIAWLVARRLQAARAPLRTP